MNKEDIKEFTKFNKRYDKWQAHKKHKHEHHNVKHNDKNDAEMHNVENNAKIDAEELNFENLDSVKDMQSVPDDKVSLWEEYEQFAFNMHVLENNDYNDKLKNNSEHTYKSLDECINTKASYWAIRVDHAKNNACSIQHQ